MWDQEDTDRMNHASIMDHINMHMSSFNQHQARALMIAHQRHYGSGPDCRFCCEIRFDGLTEIFKLPAVAPPHEIAQIPQAKPRRRRRKQDEPTDPSPVV